MEVLDYFEMDNQEYWREEIRKSDWRAAAFLCELLTENRFFESVGEKAKLLLLTEGEALMAFCTYAPSDEIDDPSLTPWLGFVYTFPKYRGARRVGKLVEYAYGLAKNEGHPFLYVSTGEVGLYEKYGFTYWKDMESIYGETSRVYRMPVENKDYSDVIGRRVKGTIDRPMGSAHPDFPDMVYPINYGYVDGIFAEDGEEQDVYVFGPTMPISAFDGEVIGVLHRLNDNEDKWIVSTDCAPLTKEEILSRIAFQEQYYVGELYL